MLKICKDCQLEKPIDEFFKDRGLKDGHSSICKKCKEIKTYAWRDKNKEKYNAGMRAYWAKYRDKRRDTDYRRKYGVTLDQYNEKFESQNRICWICKKPNKSKKRLFSLDHNHATGKARGILCFGCNRALHVLETETLLNSALAYLKHFA